jgi:hypothetical protein
MDLRRHTADTQCGSTAGYRESSVLRVVAHRQSPSDEGKQPRTISPDLRGALRCMQTATGGGRFVLVGVD